MGERGKGRTKRGEKNGIVGGKEGGSASAGENGDRGGRAASWREEKRAGEKGGSGDGVESQE